jgi:hypothetical protein
MKEPINLNYSSFQAFNPPLIPSDKKCQAGTGILPAILPNKY